MTLKKPLEIFDHAVSLASSDGFLLIADCSNTPNVYHLDCLQDEIDFARSFFKKRFSKLHPVQCVVNHYGVHLYLYDRPLYESFVVNISTLFDERAF